MYNGVRLPEIRLPGFMPVGQPRGLSVGRANRAVLFCCSLFREKLCVSNSATYLRKGEAEDKVRFHHGESDPRPLVGGFFIGGS